MSSLLISRQVVFMNSSFEQISNRFSVIGHEMRSEAFNVARKCYNIPNGNEEEVKQYIESLLTNDRFLFPNCMEFDQVRLSSFIEHFLNIIVACGEAPKVPGACHCKTCLLVLYAKAVDHVLICSRPIPPSLPIYDPGPQKCTRRGR